MYAPRILRNLVCRSEEQVDIASIGHVGGRGPGSARSGGQNAGCMPFVLLTSYTRVNNKRTLWPTPQVCRGLAAYTGTANPRAYKTYFGAQRDVEY